MTAVAHHGPPGSYKTSALVDRVAIEALKEGRVLVTNVRGLNSLVRIEKVYGIKFPKTADILYVPHSLAGFKSMARFFHWAPPGALILMDEVQRVLPTRPTFKLSSLDYPGGPDQAEVDGRPATLEQAIDEHRHFNWDIYLSTTNIAKVNREVRQVLEGAYRHRNVSGVLPWWKNSWKEFPHDAESSGKSISHYSGDPKRYTADKRVFDCYESTATGIVKQSMESKPIYKDKRLLVFGFILLLAITGFLYNLSKALSSGDPAVSVTDEVVMGSVDKENPPLSSNNVSSKPGVKVGDEAPPVVKTIHPFPSAKFYIAGSINDLLILEVEMDEKITSLTSVEFEKIGYYVERLTDCLVSLNLNGVVQYAVCHSVSDRQSSDSSTDVDLAFL
ncbi:MAG: hypothetical protein COA42_23695 [Alteromonadaceae bacterium]|nr:MAG: hypothetical protein COA42_23695 [Alteromonadaceae bacterium]